MKLGTLVENEQYLKEALSLKLKNGGKAYMLLKIIDKYIKELQTFESFRNDLIQSTGKNEIKPEDQEYNSIITKIHEALQVDLDSIQPILTVQDVEHIEISAQTIKGLITLGIME